MADKVSFEEFSKELPPRAVSALKEEEFDTLSALLCFDVTDLEGLQIKRGHVALVRETVKKLQEKHRQGPFFTAACGQRKQDTEPAVAGQSTNHKPKSLVAVKTPPPEPRSEVRVVLIGKTGTGKSALGNTLLGRDAFKSEGGLISSTRKCRWEEGSIDGTTFSVTDTPGLADTDLSDNEILPEVAKSVSLACPGPHVVILVIRCDRRFTKEEHQAVKTLKNLFGERIRKFLMVVFTGGDCFKVSRDRMQWALLQQLAGCPSTLKEVLRDLDTTYCVVDNTGSVDERKNYARDVLSMILAVVKGNKGDYFTNDMVDKYNRIVESAVEKRKRTEHISQEEAVRETRRAIVEENVEPGFFQKLLNVSRDYILPVVSTAANFAVAGRLMGAAGCQVM